jgi:tRNA A-37 threonylcarbamoyl transferase component Bud32
LAFALVGQTVEHFELLAPLGAGAMSEVYLGRDTRLDKQVAVKVINENLLRRPDLVERFEREARAAARLSHPNVATVYFFGNFQGKPFYAMELIRGWSLGEITEHRAAFTWDQMLGLFAQAAFGLQAAQHAGILHRDIKPGNLMATEGGVLKIVDFGLAKLGDDKSLTRSGAMMGTPYYIAPEVVQGQGSDHLSDIYSLGVTMFHNLAGRPPYDAETPYGVMMQHISEPVPSLHALNPQFPAPLSDLVEVMMAKSPSDRPRSYGDVAVALRGIADELGPDHLARTLTWCHFDKSNTEADGQRCGVCKRPRGAREVPEIFHVDLVGWHRNDAVDAVSGYIGKAVGQGPAEIRTLLDPLPFRAAFRVPRERARRMQRTFYELGADVSLVPADDEGDGRRALRELPFPAVWPQARKREGPNGPQTTSTKAIRVKPPRRGLELSPAVAVAAGLAVVVLVLVGVLVGRELGSPAPVISAGDPALPPEERPPEAATPPPGAADDGDAAAGEDALDAVDPEPADPEADDDVAEAELAAPIEPEEEEEEEPPPDAFATERVRLTGAVDADAAPALLRAFDDAASRVEDQTGSAAPSAAELRLVRRPFSEWRRAPTWPVIEFPIDGVQPARLGAAADELMMRAAIQRDSEGRAPVWLAVGLGAWLAEGPTDPAEWPEIASRGTSPTELTSLVFLAAPEARQTVRAFVSWLLKEKGWERIGYLLGYLRDGQDLDVATRRAMGDSTFPELEQLWMATAGAGL